MKITKCQMGLWVLVVTSFGMVEGSAAPADEKGIGVAPGRPRVVRPTINPDASIFQNIEERLATGSNRSGIIYRKAPADLTPKSEHKNSDPGLKREKNQNLLLKPAPQERPAPLAVPARVLFPPVPTVEYPKREEDIPKSSQPITPEPSYRSYDRETEVGYDETIYYPGYLPNYSYEEGGFVYGLSPSPPSSPPEVIIAPPPLSQATRIPDELPISSVAAFVPNQAVISQVLLSGFSVHVGSFLEYEQAFGLETKLREQAIPFFRTPILLNGISYIQIHVGPFQKRYMAESMAVLIRDTLSINGVLLFYGQ